VQSDPLSDPRGVTPAGAVRDFVLEVVAGIRSIPPEQWRGELGYLAAMSPDRTSLRAGVVRPPGCRAGRCHQRHHSVRPGSARLYGIALAGVFQIIIDEAGRPHPRGPDPAQIADELYRS